MSDAMDQRLIFDAHLDLSMNALDWNRDYRQSVAAIRLSERGRTDKPDRGRNVCSLPEMRRGRIGLCVATLIGRAVAPDDVRSGWHSPEIAWAHTQGQLAWYRAMEEQGWMKPITDTAGLHASLSAWLEHDGAAAPPPIGYVLSLEGADSILTVDHLERAWASGLRALGPAHYGPGRYAHGTGASAHLSGAGRDLLRKMESLGMILDATHLCDDAFWDAMEVFHGHVWASHSNCRKLVPNDRQFSDDQLGELIGRGAVIGAAFDAWMLVPWVRGRSTVESTGVKLEHVARNIDHVCQLAGDSLHSGIGSDLDGGYGAEQSPGDLETIADLQKLSALLGSRGYSTEDVENILWRNWVRFLETAWGEPAA